LRSSVRERAERTHCSCCSLIPTVGPLGTTRRIATGHFVSSMSTCPCSLSWCNGPTHRPTRKCLRFEFTVPNHQRAVDEQVLYPDTRLIRPLVRRPVLHGRRVENSDVSVHAHLEPALFYVQRQRIELDRVFLHFSYTFQLSGRKDLQNQKLRIGCGGPLRTE